MSDNLFFDFVFDSPEDAFLFIDFLSLNPMISDFFLVAYPIDPCWCRDFVNDILLSLKQPSSQVHK